MADPSGEDKPSAMVTSTGYGYSDASSNGNPNIQIPSHLVTQLQAFETNPDIYNLASGIEIMGFPSKNLHQHGENSSLLWKEFFTRQGNNASSSKQPIDEPTSTSEIYQHDVIETTNVTLMVSPDSWNQQRLIAEDPSLRCVFPCEGNERPSQGLSLSLSSSNPSTIGVQSFELRQHEDLRFGPSSSRSVNMMNEHFVIRGSKYLQPVQELLNEFCYLAPNQNDNSPKVKNQKANDWHDENDQKNQSLYSLDLLELQQRKTKLLQMLEEVDRRYKHYHDQMKSVVSSFETVAGNGAAASYSSLASKAMSKHFRCLRDGIVGQIKDTKKAMGEKDTAAPGSTKGETPRLRLLDQSLRQQRAFQQMSMMDSHPWRPQRGLPERSVSVLRAWLFEHFLHPYPSDVDKHILARQTGLSRSQVSNWFINARVRLWKPMVEEMYLEELKEQESVDGNSNGVTANLDENAQNQDQKPPHDQLGRIDSESLSSIINNPEKSHGRRSKTLQDYYQKPSFGRVGDSFGAMELDFSSYNHQSATGASGNGGGGYNGGGVSLTLGLQQHGGASGGVSLAFTPASQSSLFYPKDHNMQDSQTGQFSILDTESQNLPLPYRDLIGAQLLHDLAG